MRPHDSDSDQMKKIYVHLLQKLDLIDSLTQGFSCDHPWKIVYGMAVARRKVESMVALESFYDDHVM